MLLLISNTGLSCPPPNVSSTHHYKLIYKGHFSKVTQNGIRQLLKCPQNNYIAPEQSCTVLIFALVLPNKINNRDIAPLISAENGHLCLANCCYHLQPHSITSSGTSMGGGKGSTPLFFKESKDGEGKLRGGSLFSNPATITLTLILSNSDTCQIRGRD